MTPAERPLPNELDGRYRLLRLIGQGGMGTVYEAEHVSLRRRCAVKLLRRDLVPTPTAARRFEREASVLARLVHENVVSVFDIGSTRDGQPFLVLEYIEGGTLRAELERSGIRGLARVLEIVVQMCRGLAHAHAAGIVHRDLKPENVMLSRHADGRLLVKLLDFGIARPTDGPAEPVTRTDAVLGTAAYMSPEQARGERGAPPAIDVFALGVIVYEALAGKRPFEGASYNETLYAILNKPHAPLARYRPELPPHVTEAVDRALAKDRGRRFEGVAEFAAALGLPDLGEPMPSISASPPDALATRPEPGAGPPRRRFGWRSAPLAASIVLALAGATAAVRRGHEAEAPRTAASSALAPGRHAVATPPIPSDPSPPVELPALTASSVAPPPVASPRRPSSKPPAGRLPMPSVQGTEAAVSGRVAEGSSKALPPLARTAAVASFQVPAAPSAPASSRTFMTGSIAKSPYLSEAPSGARAP
ncbi:MAG TPA: protein kinase [Polyangiaceae bacterium]